MNNVTDRHIDHYIANHVARVSNGSQIKFKLLINTENKS